MSSNYIHIAADDKILFFFCGWIIIPLCIYNTFSLFFHLLMHTLFDSYVKSTAVSMNCRYLFDVLISVPLDNIDGYRVAMIFFFLC
jgi:hypothetical protein